MPFPVREDEEGYEGSRFRENEWGLPTALTSSKMYHEYQLLTEMAVFARNPTSCFQGEGGVGVEVRR